MPVAIGATPVTAIHIGATAVSAAYVGGAQVFSAAPPPVWATTAASGPGASNTVNATVPAGVAAGDVLLAFVTLLGAPPTVVVTPPAGFTPQGPTAIGTVAGQPIQTHLYAKQAVAADTGTYVFGLDSSQTWIADITRYTGAGGVDAAAGAASTALGATTPPVALTTTGPNRLLVWCAFDYNAQIAATTPPAGFTTVEWAGSRSKIVDKTQPAAGPTGSVTGTTTVPGGDNYTVWLAALKPSGAIRGIRR